MIWLIGNRGMLGREVERQLQAAGLQYSATDMDVDITSPEALRAHAGSVFKDGSSRWVINCSAYTAVDKAEDEPALAAKINTEGVKNIAECAAAFDATVIHMSTDYVFDGMNPEPLTEDLPTGPASVYGRTKLDGENALVSATGRYFIIRTAWLYGLSGPNFVYTMLKLMEDRDSITVVNDQHGSPTNAADLAALIITILKSESTDYGIYHYSNEGNITWFNFASEIYRLGREYGLVTSECEVSPCSSDQYPTKATRPEYSLLSKEKVKSVFGIEVPDWKDSLKDFINSIEDFI